MNRSRLVYVIRFVVAAWLAVAGLAGTVTGIFYLCQKNVIVSQLLLYSGVFGFMGWQQYERKTWEKWRRSNRFGTD